MRLRRLAAVAFLASLATGCAPALSTLQPATVVPHKHVHGVVGYGLSVPVGGIARSVGEAKDAVDRAESGEPLTDEERDRLIETSVGLALNPPSFGNEFQIGYGIMKNVELDVRYAVSSWRLGARYQFLSPPEYGPVPAAVPAATPPSDGVTTGEDAAAESIGVSSSTPARTPITATGLSGTAGIGISRYTLGLPGVPRFAKRIVDVSDFTRIDVDLPVLLGISHDVVHLWAGPKLVVSFMEAGVNVCTEVDTSNGNCTRRAEARLDARTIYAAGQAGIALGYKYAWLAFEFTGAYARTEMKGTVTDGTTRENRKYTFNDFILYPVVGLIIRI